MPTKQEIIDDCQKKLAECNQQLDMLSKMVNTPTRIVVQIANGDTTVVANKPMEYLVLDYDTENCTDTLIITTMTDGSEVFKTKPLSASVEPDTVEFLWDEIHKANASES